MNYQFNDTGNQRCIRASAAGSMDEVFRPWIIYVRAGLNDDYTTSTMTNSKSSFKIILSEVVGKEDFLC